MQSVAAGLLCADERANNHERIESRLGREPIVGLMPGQSADSARMTGKWEVIRSARKAGDWALPRQ